MPIPRDYLSPENNLYQFLDTNGDESGTTDALGDHSGAADDYYIQPPSTEVYELARLIIFIQSTTVLASGKYGDQAALTNGIKVIIENNGTEILLNKVAVKTHDDWAGICFNSENLNYGNVAGKSVAIRWSFFKAERNIYLNGANSDKFILRLNDDFSNLVHHRFFMQGVKHSIA
jgi:hypothetical protein